MSNKDMSFEEACARTSHLLADIIPAAHGSSVREQLKKQGPFSVKEVLERAADAPLSPPDRGLKLKEEEKPSPKEIQSLVENATPEERKKFWENVAEWVAATEDTPCESDAGDMDEGAAPATMEPSLYHCEGPARLFGLADQVYHAVGSSIDLDRPFPVHIEGNESPHWTEFETVNGQKVWKFTDPRDLLLYRQFSFKEGERPEFTEAIRTGSTIIWMYAAGAVEVGYIYDGYVFLTGAEEQNN